MRVRCNGCQGEYDTVQDDGLPYFHVCPGVRALLVRNKDGSTSYVTPGDEGGRLVLGERYFDQPGHRDERPAPDSTQAALRVRKAGAGVTELDVPKPRMELSVPIDEVER